MAYPNIEVIRTHRQIPETGNVEDYLIVECDEVTVYKDTYDEDMANLFKAEEIQTLFRHIHIEGQETGAKNQRKVSHMGVNKYD